MIWKILTFVFGWLLCGAWAVRMLNKDDNKVTRDVWAFYVAGLVALIITWFAVWPKRLYRFTKCIKPAWKQALKDV